MTSSMMVRHERGNGEGDKGRGEEGKGLGEVRGVKGIENLFYYELFCC